MVLRINKLRQPPDDSFGLSIKQLRKLYNSLRIRPINCLLGLVDPKILLIFKGREDILPAEL